MKTFDEYSDGDWVVYRNIKSEWHNMQFQAYKSQYTHNAFRLKYGSREVVADISEVSPISEINNLLQEEYNAKPNTDLQPDLGRGRSAKERQFDSDADSSGIYHLDDDYVDLDLDSRD